ncbi:MULTISPECIES: hypothetical protein [Amycolatopsis]|uniref:Uncharacterized protein n=1 Tax=Amycolatopsis thermalba TaxID=944492 RepID=A0ABY4P4S4_9PSEU|nr:MULTISPECIES: hypothetical protein [Amycolatopsis]OXM73125.1 hypothetical protein CF166_11450 [Amycolatopsis sp. KNN50.9b]UQS27196.1 hypothetical protein L1857_32530 [Amycolatopsis thermalba]
MTTTSHDHQLQADAFRVGDRLMYLDRDDDGPDKVTVRVGVVSGKCRTGEEGLLVPMTDEDGGERWIAASDVLGSGSRAGNRHETDRPARWRHHLSPSGRHHRQEAPES